MNRCEQFVKLRVAPPHHATFLPSNYINSCTYFDFILHNLPRSVDGTFLLAIVYVKIESCHKYYLDRNLNFQLCNSHYSTLHRISVPISLSLLPSLILNRFKQPVSIENMEAVIFLTSVTFIIAVGGAIIQGYGSSWLQ